MLAIFDVSMLKKVRYMASYAYPRIFSFKSTFFSLKIIFSYHFKLLKKLDKNELKLCLYPPRQRRLYEFPPISHRSRKFPILVWLIN